MIDPERRVGEKLRGARRRSSRFYAGWYPSRWLGWGRWPRTPSSASSPAHLRFVERSARKLARAIFHGMAASTRREAAEQAGASSSALVDIANELFAMAAAVTRAHALRATGARRGRRAPSSPTSSAATRGARCGGSSATSGATTTASSTR